MILLFCQRVRPSRVLQHGPVRRHVSNITLLGKKYPTDSFTNVPPSIIAKLPLRLHTNPSHPLGILRSLIQSHFSRFNHFGDDLSSVVTTYENFDSLNFPLDHPGRNPTDSYYVNKDTMLRTHTSAHEVEMYKKGDKKWTLTADVYRRDEIDATHYPVFHQMEMVSIFDADKHGMKEAQEDNARLEALLSKSNIIIEDVPHSHPNTNPAQSCHDPTHVPLVVQNLKLNINSLLLQLFGTNSTPENPLQVRWIEAYFPWTTPSFEVEILFRGKWLEILGSGVVVNQTLETGNTHNKIAWAAGLGLERIAMILFSIPDIRLFWSTDKRFLDQFSEGTIATFKPYSKYPPSYQDVSFWEGEGGVHENDFCDIVRDVAGDMVEDVKNIDTFKHPKTNRTSQCYRINLRSMDRSLSTEETNDIISRVKSHLVNRFGVEIR